jgi:ribosomal protein L37AE/L43A
VELMASLAETGGYAVPANVTTAELRRHMGLERAGETAEFRWCDVKQCPSCESTDIERQTADEGRPFSCNNCGLEFFKDTA